MTRACPHCGELVPSDCIRCPRCYKDIPSEEKEAKKAAENVRTGDGSHRTDGKNIDTATALAVLPAFIGVLGLGQIYLEPREGKGYWFLAIGLLFWIPLVILVSAIFRSGIVTAFLLAIAAAVLGLLYVSAAIASIIDAHFGSVFRFLRI
jgi:hypothetical protein